jgi:hypothetical protein
MDERNRVKHVFLFMSLSPKMLEYNENNIVNSKHEKDDMPHQ